MLYFILQNRNSTQEKIKCKLKAGNSCYYSVLTLLPVVRHDLMLVLREECRLRIQKRIFGPKRDENGECRKLHNAERTTLYHLIDLGRLNTEY